MAKCKYGQKGVCDKLYHPNCPDNSECYEYELFTNAERIREMSDKELAEYFAKTFCHGYGQPQLLDWLQKPATEEGENG
jgi:hypothetical protein